MKKVLIITYYWPPSGGAGVQRWVKLAKYLVRQGVQPYVITVHEKQASYLKLDESLVAEVSPEIKVYKTKSVEPINFYSKLAGKKNVPSAGFSNVDPNSRGQKIINFIRSHLFIPDPRRGWNRFAFQKAVELIRSENITHVITSSPPHSSQLIGLRLKQKFKVTWIADLRDPWTDIYYYKLLRHSLFSGYIDSRLEKKVLLMADKLITVSDQIKRLFAEKDPGIGASKIHVIPNGFDHDDFEGIERKKQRAFTICYTGTMSSVYQPKVFFQSLKVVMDRNPDFEIKFQVVGDISEAISKEIADTGLAVELVPTVTHDQVVKYQINADLLLLVIPNVENSGGILTGKLFEYLATRNRILGIGPENGDAAKIVKQCKSGQVLGRENTDSIQAFIQQELDNHFIKGTKVEADWEEIRRYSRERQAAEIKSLLDECRT
ncbi:MAG: glycosyltransferase family 4 protein [Cyclobacteriaceae bacterium]|nr:glycosyltransferase family 4 protein [Cyclobacteriaceae bacterium]